MDSSEILAEMEMNYDDLVAYLLGKYGKAQYDYFLTDKCVSKNRKVTRTSEGLLCHHIDENIHDDLSEPHYAIKSPFASQKADRLVYCNYIEHLLLQFKSERTATGKRTQPYDRRPHFQHLSCLVCIIFVMT